MISLLGTNMKKLWLAGGEVGRNENKTHQKSLKKNKWKFEKWNIQKYNDHCFCQTIVSKYDHLNFVECVGVSCSSTSEKRSKTYWKKRGALKMETASKTYPIHSIPYITTAIR